MDIWAFIKDTSKGTWSILTVWRRWGQEDRAEIEKTYRGEIEVLQEQLSDAESDEEKAPIGAEIQHIRDELRSFYRARRDLLLSKSLVQKMTPIGDITAGGPELPQADRQLLEAAASVVARLEPPKTFEEHLRQGNAFYASGVFDKALEEHIRAVELQPDSPAALMNCGNALERLKRYDEAVVYFNRSLEFRPDHPGALTGRAMAMTGLKRYDEALADYGRSLELKPDDEITLNNRGTTLQSMQRYEEALADYGRALDLAPDIPITIYNSAAVLSLMGRLQQSLEHVRKAISHEAKWRETAREDEDFESLRSDPTLGPQFERLVAEPEE